MFPQAARVWTPSFVRHCTPALSNQTSVHTNMFPSLDSWAGNDKRAPGHCQQSTEESDYTIFKRQDHQIVNTLEREWIILSLFPSVQHRTWCPREPSEFTDSDFLNEPATSCFTQPKYTETVAKVKPTTETIGSQCLSNTDSSGATSEWRAHGGCDSKPKPGSQKWREGEEWKCGRKEVKPQKGGWRGAFSKVHLKLRYLQTLCSMFGWQLYWKTKRKSSSWKHLETCRRVFQIETGECVSSLSSALQFNVNTKHPAPLKPQHVGN